MGYEIDKNFKTKQDLIYEEIKNSIIDCELLPSQKISIRNLAAKYGISESPTRDAIKMLISEDFLYSDANGLIYVAPLTKEEFLDMLDVRLDMEKIAIRQSCKNATLDDIKKLEEIIGEIKSLYEKGALVEYEKKHIEFHLETFKICGVNYLYSAVSDAICHSERGIKFFNLKKWDHIPKIEEHIVILEGIKKGDVEYTVNSLVKNRTNAFEFYKRQVCV